MSINSKQYFSPPILKSPYPSSRLCISVLLSYRIAYRRGRRSPRPPCDGGVVARTASRWLGGDGGRRRCPPASLQRGSGSLPGGVAARLGGSAALGGHQPRFAPSGRSDRQRASGGDVAAADAIAPRRRPPPRPTRERSGTGGCWRRGRGVVRRHRRSALPSPRRVRHQQQLLRHQ